MASQQQCEQALHALAARLADVDPELRARHVVTRTVSCRVPDLDLVFFATLDDEGLGDVRVAPGEVSEDAQVRLCASSDDLLALVEGEVSAPLAWATGRLKVQASPLDLLKLRALL